MKICSHCKQTKTYESFSKNKGRADGYHHQCKVCRKEYYEINKVSILLTNSKGYYDKRNIILAKVKQRYVEKRDDILAYQARYREVNKDKVNARIKNWGKQNRNKKLTHNNKRRATKLQRTPKWVDAEELWLIAEVYDLAERRNKVTNIKWHVDHIVPLQGRLVSGLHVTSNLQVIPAKLNLSKGNRYNDQT